MNLIGDEGDSDEDLNAELSGEERELFDLAGDIEEEELTRSREHQVDHDNDGCVDEVAELAETKKAAYSC